MILHQLDHEEKQHLASQRTDKAPHFLLIIINTCLQPSVLQFLIAIIPQAIALALATRGDSQHREPVLGKQYKEQEVIGTKEKKSHIPYLYMWTTTHYTAIVSPCPEYYISRIKIRNEMIPENFIA